jgi:prephenate dehydrogenase
MALREARPDWELRGLDSDAGTRRRAREMGLISSGDVTETEVLVLAAPIPALPELLAGLAAYPGIVTDLASTKARVMGWAAAAGVDLVGGHPMCGRELSGLAAADPTIFQGAPWILTRDAPPVTELVQAVDRKSVV